MAQQLPWQTSRKQTTFMHPDHGVDGWTDDVLSLPWLVSPLISGLAAAECGTWLAWASLFCRPTQSLYATIAEIQVIASHGRPMNSTSYDIWSYLVYLAVDRNEACLVQSRGQLKHLLYLRQNGRERHQFGSRAEYVQRIRLVGPDSKMPYRTRMNCCSPGGSRMT